ncbi:mucin-associated surface protein (MASP), putative, partial [Trypanosoma cruzi marinkellei]
IKNQQERKQPPSPGQQKPVGTPSPGVETLAALSSAVEDPAGKETITPAPNDSHNSKEESHKASPLHTETESAAKELLSPDSVLEQNTDDTFSPDLKEDADTGSPVATTEPSTSTSNSGVAQNKTDEDDGNEQRPELKGPHNDTDAGNTNVAPRASESEPDTVKTVTTQTNGTSNSGDSDGSTAVSHTTSSLLLLVVVACAAAAAVVAA